MTTLLDLPYEVLHSIFKETEPDDIPAIYGSCRSLNCFVKNNRLLYKELYLQNWDDPCVAVADADFLWEHELPKLINFKRILESGDRDLKKAELASLTDTVVQLLNAASCTSEPSRNITFLTNLVARTVNTEVLLQGSSLWSHFNQQLDECSTRANQVHQQLSAKLHCLYGTPACVYSYLEEPDIAEEQQTKPIHQYARARVYDLRRYTRNTFWGPFRDDGSQDVDWEKMEAIMILLDYNFQLFKEHRQNPFIQPSWQQPFLGATPNSYVPATDVRLLEEPQLPLDLTDPYGVSGNYRRIVCFLDYTALFAYNFAYDPPAPDVDRAPLDEEEAIRLIVMQLRLTSLEPPGPNDGQALPVAHFTGTTRSMHSSWDPNASSDIRGPTLRGWRSYLRVQERRADGFFAGTVSLTKEGEVRWTTFSIYHGEERWRSEGVQVGGLKSARGVLGNWFDKDYDRHGPAGPTAFWKYHDGVEEGRRRVW